MVTTSAGSILDPTRDVYKKKRRFLRGGGSTGGPGKRSFHAPHSDCDFSFPTQSPVKTVLQKYLGEGEFPSFRRVAMFESSFLQVTRRGKHVFFHNHYHEAIIGIASTNSKLPLPNLMFIARPAASQVSSEQYPEELMLTRLLPLKFVHISIYDSEKQLIKIKLINGRSYYLQLYTSTEEEEDDLFNRWLSLVYLLHHPPASYLQPQPKSCMQLDELSVEVIPSEEEAEHARKSSAKKKKQKRKKKKKKEEQRPPEAAKSHTQSLDSIAKETYTEYEQLRLRTLFHQTSSEWSLEEMESYQGSRTAAQKPAEIYSTESDLSAALAALSLSRSSLPPRKIPEKGKHGSLNIVTIFSVISKILEEEKGGNRKN